MDPTLGQQKMLQMTFMKEDNLGFDVDTEVMMLI